MTNKVAFITGASRGIGAESAVALAQAGYQVAITARTLSEGERHDYIGSSTELPGSLEATAAAVQRAGGEALCLRGDILEPQSMVAAAQTDKPINLKKGQFVSPWDMENGVNKLRGAGGTKTMLVERGASFGYNNLVSDMRSLAVMRETGSPVVFDATHSVQLPGGQGACSGGQREFVPVLARAAVAVGVAGVFMETHPDPSKALSDGPNAWPLDQMKALLEVLKELDHTVKANDMAEI